MDHRSNRCCRAAQLPLLLSSVPVLSVVFFSSDVHTWSLQSKPWWWSWGLGARWAYSCFCNAATIMAQLDTAFLVAPLIFCADMIADTSLTDGSGHCGTTTPALEPHLSLVQASWNVQLLQSLIIRRLWLIPQLLSAVWGLRGCVGSSSKTEPIYPYLILLCWSSMDTTVAFCLLLVTLCILYTLLCVSGGVGPGEGAWDEEVGSLWNSGQWGDLHQPAGGPADRTFNSSHFYQYELQSQRVRWPHFGKKNTDSECVQPAYEAPESRSHHLTTDADHPTDRDHLL